jgi:tRNA U34 2-thiouridine synthase MnmA/TrmU
VVSYTISEAQAGRTPNPDIMCNSRVKFGVFYDEVGRHFPTVATGHYARTVRAPHPSGGSSGCVVRAGITAFFRSYI